MANLSAYMEGLIAGWLRGVNFPPPPPDIFLVLSSVSLGDDGTGITEPAAVNGYARQPISFAAPVSNNNDGTTIANSNNVVFGPASSNWIAVGHTGVFDFSGNLLFYAPMNVQRTALVGDSIIFDANAIALTIVPPFTNSFAENILNWIRGIPMPPAPTGLEQLLLTGDINADLSGLVEPSTGDGYTRRPISFSVPVQVNSIGTTMTTDVDAVFGPAATNDWDQVKATGIASNGGDILFVGSISSPRNAVIGDTVPFSAGATTILIR